MANEVLLTTTLSKNHVPVTNGMQLFYCLLEVMPTEVMATVRAPLNFSLVLDTSGSMSGKKIQCVKEAVKYVIDLLDQNDFISIIEFDSKTRTLVSSQQVKNASDKAALKAQVDKLSASGGTTLAPAMRAGMKEIKKQMVPNGINRLLLLTDGDTTGMNDCKKEAQKAQQDNIPVTALGIGTDWKEDFLLELAAKNGDRGVADYIAKADEIARYFQNTVQSMQATVVQNATLTLRLVGGVNPRKVWRVVPMISDLGYRPLSDRFLTVPLGELEKDQGQGILVELTLPPRQPGTYRIAQAEISYDIPLLNLVQEKARSDLVLSFTYDPNLARQVNPKVMNIVERVTAFKLQTRALQDAEKGNVRGATQKLRSAVTMLLNQGEADLAQTLQKEADKLQQQGQLSSEGKKTIKFKSRKTVRLG